MLPTPTAFFYFKQTDGHQSVLNSALLAILLKKNPLLCPLCRVSISLSVAVWKKLLIQALQKSLESFVTTTISLYVSKIQILYIYRARKIFCVKTPLDIFSAFLSNLRKKCISRKNILISNKFRNFSKNIFLNQMNV